MGRRKTKQITVDSVEIYDTGSEGLGVGKHGEKVVFVTGAVPGDIVNIKVTQKRSSFLKGEITELVKASEDRIEPFCEHFGLCGGCKWQQLSYETQLKFKHKKVVDNLERIGKLELKEVFPILGSTQTKYYRNKLQFTFSNRGWLTNEQIQTGEDIDRRFLGFHVPGGFDKVLDLKECFLQPEPSNSLRLRIAELTKELDIPYYDLKGKTGSLRNVTFRNNEDGEWMVIFMFFFDDEKNYILMDRIQVEFPQITSMNYVINSKPNDSFDGLTVKTYKGNDHLIEKMEHLQFKVGPKSFYQTNSKQAYELYKVAREFAELTGNETVYDLYSGTGTIANFVAHQAKQVIGIEYVDEAIEDAKVNSALNNITNTQFYAGDMRHVLTPEFVAQHGTADVVITDPPRAGMHEDVIQTILAMNAPTVVYVSCNPATQARDLALMSHAYDVTKVQPVDMFPQTAHIENVVQLKRKA